MGFALTPGEAPLHFSRSKNVMHVAHDGECVTQAMLEIGEVPRSLFVMSAMPKDSMAIPARKHISRLMKYGMNHDSFRVFCPM